MALEATESIMRNSIFNSKFRGTSTLSQGWNFFKYWILIGRNQKVKNWKKRKWSKWQFQYFSIFRNFAFGLFHLWNYHFYIRQSFRLLVSLTLTYDLDLWPLNLEPMKIVGIKELFQTESMTVKSNTGFWLVEILFFQQTIIISKWIWTKVFKNIIIWLMPCPNLSSLV